MGNFETGWKYWGECDEAYPDAPWGESPRWKPDSPSKVQAVAMERRWRHWQWVLTHTCSCKVALFQVERWKLLGFEAETWKRTYLCLLPVSAWAIFSRKEVIPGILWRDRLQLFSEVRQGDRQLKALALGKPYTQNLSWEWRMWLDFNLDRCQHKHPTFVKGGGSCNISWLSLSVREPFSLIQQTAEHQLWSWSSPGVLLKNIQIVLFLLWICSQTRIKQIFILTTHTLKKCLEEMQM